MYKVITLCGSTKFKSDFERVNKEFTLAGYVVISVGCFGHSGDEFTEEQKIMLDDIHKQKIDMADIVYIINKDGYIGKSTQSEIEYARERGKKILYMEDPGVVADKLRQARRTIENLLNVRKEDLQEGTIAQMYYSFGIRDACWELDKMIEECK